MSPRSVRRLVKLLPIGATLLCACSAGSGREAAPRTIDGAGGSPVLPAMPAPAVPMAGAPMNTGTGEGFPDFGDVGDAPPADTPITRTDCGSGPPTTVRSSIYDPAGRLPLYNVMVYVPSAELDPIVEGVSCDRCDTTASGRPVAAAITDPNGAFVMENVPDGTNIPLVIQMGKWRRQIVLPEVRPCQENVFDDRDQFRLPRDQSEGHLPKVAMTTGSADKLECLLRLIGVADAEFTTPEGGGRVNLYHETGTESLASGATLPAATALLGSAEALGQYDVVILSCHGDSGHGREQPTSEKEAMKAYLDRGGRAFGSHFYFSYLRSDDDNHLTTPFPDVGVWDGDAPDTYVVNTSFPKGQAFAEWLVNVGASPALGSIALESVEGAASVLDTPYTQSWISADNSVPYFSLNLPIEKVATPDEQCGRLVHTGIHVSEGEEAAFPTGCDESRELTPQEMALEFLIFDLSACPSNLDEPPVPPPVVIPR
jgi:hypothetical protein